LLDSGCKFFFVVFSLLRFSLNLGILERPLVQGLVWGLLTGDVGQAVSISLVFELLWLDLIPAGTFIPPNPAAANFAALSLVTIHGFSGASQSLFPILMGMPLAWLAAGMERMHRSWQNTAYNTMQVWLRAEHQGEYAPGLLVRRAVTQAAACYFLFFLVSLSVLTALSGMLLERGFLRLPSDLLTWGTLWLWASLGGLMSLRVPRAYAVIASGALAMAVVSIFG